MNKLTFEESLKRIPRERLRDEDYEALWSALANTSCFRLGLHKGEFTLDDIDDFSFRAAGSLVANLWNHNHPKEKRKDYIDYYCCGPYATVTPKISKLLASVGWGITEDPTSILISPDQKSANAYQWLHNNGYTSYAGGAKVEGKYIAYRRNSKGQCAGQYHCYENEKNERTDSEPFQVAQGIIYEVEIHWVEDNKNKLGKVLYDFVVDGPVDYKIPEPM